VNGTYWNPPLDLSALVHPPLPLDPGGEMTPERIDVLRERALASGHGAMLNALEEIEGLRAERRRTAIEVKMLRRCARDANRIAWWDPWEDEWPPAWLATMVEQGRADALQADRARVLGYDNTGGRDTWGAPPVTSQGRRWWTHAQPPREHDEDAYQAARRVLDACKGREP
jgi:hypothetical protein